MTSKLKKILAFFLSFLIFTISAFPVYASMSSPTEITSDYLFEQSTLDNLQLNFNTLPDVKVEGFSDKYWLVDTDNVWSFNWSVKNRRIEFIDKADTTTHRKTLGFDTHYPDLKIIATYSNCGTLNGKAIDIILTYSDFWTSPQTGSDRYDTKTLWWTACGTPDQQTPQNEWFAVGFSKFNLDIKLQYHDDSSSVHLQNAYFTLYSMDGGCDSNNKLVHSEAAASSTATNAYWYKDRWMKYSSTYNYSNKYSIKNLYYGTKSHQSGSRDTRTAMCFQYQNVDSINLDMVVCAGQWSEGYHVNFTPLTAVIPDAPTKTVSSSKATAGTQLDFEIKQEMPKSFDSNFTLQAFSIDDQLDQYLTYKSATLYDETNKDITSAAGTISYSGSLNEVTYTFNSDFLNAANYNGQTFTLKISTILKDNVPVEKLTNSATTTFNATVTLTTDEVPVSIYYPVTAKYVDKNNTPLSENIIQNVNVGDKYTTTAKNIPNYQLSEVSGDETGTITDHAVTVTYIYEPAGTSVTANYLDEQHQKIANSETINGHVFDQYNTTAKEIYGYELTETPSNASGTMTEEPITVDYIYRLKDAKVTVKWVNETGAGLAPSETITGKVFDPYTTSSKDFYGYRLTATPTNASGTMTESDITVTYVYTQKQASVTANYLNEQNEVISESVITTGNVGDSYSTNKKDIYGYTLKEVQGEPSGNLTEEDIVVNYIYQLKNTSVFVNYLDQENNPLTDSVTIQGKVFDKYNTENKTFYGYELTAVPDNASGVMTEGRIVVNYIYKLKDTSVLVNYVDEDHQPIAESETISGKVFDSYSTTPKTIYGYELTATPSNAKGEMTEAQIVVNYVYRLKDSSVLVNYVDEDGKQIAESTTIEGKVGQSYESTSKDIYGYELTATPDNASGTFAEEQTVVNYIYRLKTSSVIVNYVDENQKPLADSFTLNGKVFEPYTTEAKEFYGYTLTMTPDNASGQFVENQIIVNYVYALKDAIVTVKYVDEHNTPLSDDITIDGKVFDEYSTESKNFYGYTLNAMPDKATGTMTEEPITVVYVYSLNNASVIVNYVDDQGNALTDPVTLTGKVFDPYTTEQKEFYGYELTGVPDNASGQMSNEQTVVNYVYTLKNGSVLVNYVTDEGQQLTDPITLSGKVFDDYSTEPKEFYGYALTATPNNANGRMGEEPITVTYVYKRAESGVTINFLDENHQVIAPGENITGLVGDPYTTSAKEIYGYELTKDPDNANGVYTEDPITVNYIYRLKDASVIVNYIDEDGNSISDSVTLIGKVGNEYTSEPKDIYGYKLTTQPDNASGVMVEDVINVDYIYRLKDTSVVVYYVDENGNTLTDSITINGKVFDSYNTTAKNINGYTLATEPDNAKGTMTEDAINVVYIYKPATNTSVPGIPDTGDHSPYTGEYTGQNEVVFLTVTLLSCSILLISYIFLKSKKKI